MALRKWAQFALTALAAGIVLSAGQAIAADNFDSVVAKAKQEGVVVMHGLPGIFHAAVLDAFAKAYPDIKVQYSDAPNPDDMAKAIGEHQKGIYNWDVWVSGPGVLVDTMQKAGMLQPLLPILRPEIVQDDKWRGGFAFGWLDEGKRLVYGFDATIQTPLYVNWDVVPRASLTEVNDLLKPEFAGKIAWHDPRLDGAGLGRLGNASSVLIYFNLGEKGLVDLYKSMAASSADHKQLAEWVVSGKYPIVIGLDDGALRALQAQGRGKNVAPLPDTAFKVQQVVAGIGGVAFIAHAPHPNAAAVFINWLLSKDGQEAYIKVMRNSRRLDVKPPLPDLAPVVKRDYFFGEQEKNVEIRTHLVQLAKQTLDTH